LAWTARAFLHEHGGISKRDGRCWMRTVERTGVLSLACGSAQVGDASLELRPGRVPVLRIGAALACIAALALAILITALPGGKPPSPGRGLETAAATGLPASLVPAASASIGASQQRFWPVRRGASLATQGGGIESSFSASGARLGVAGGALSMSLASIGRGPDAVAMAPAAPASAGGQVIYKRGSISELYRNGPYGLEQAFVLAE